MNNPHDKLFKAAFSEPTVVASLIEDLFPVELARSIKLDSLQLTNGSYTDETLEEHFADLVYECQLTTGEPLQIVLLLEHKSYTVKYPHLQLLRYMLNRWQEDVDHKKKLMPVVPVIIYHGDEPWQQEPFRASLRATNELLLPYFPAFDYILVNLSALSDEQISSFRSRFLALSAAMMKHRKDEQYEHFLRTVIAPLLALVQERELQHMLIPIFVYAVETSELTGRQIISIFKTTNQTGATMTTLERFQYEMDKIGREEGHEKGLEEGREEGREEKQAEMTYKMVKGALKLGMDAQSIAVTFEIDLADVKKALAQIRQEINN